MLVRNMLLFVFCIIFLLSSIVLRSFRVILCCDSPLLCAFLECVCVIFNIIFVALYVFCTAYSTSPVSVNEYLKMYMLRNACGYSAH